MSSKNFKAGLRAAIGKPIQSFEQCVKIAFSKFENVRVVGQEDIFVLVPEIDSDTYDMLHHAEDQLMELLGDDVMFDAHLRVLPEGVSADEYMGEKDLGE